MFGEEPERYWEIALKESAHIIATNVACLRKTPNVLIVCGSHNKMLAEYIMLESQRMRAHPNLWAFDEEFFVKSSEKASEDWLLCSLSMCAVLSRNQTWLCG